VDVDVDVAVGALVELVGLVTVTVLVSGGGTATVVVTVLTLVVVVVLEMVVVAAAEAITPQAIRLPDSPLSPLKFPGFWWTTSAVPELFRRSAAVNALVVVTSFAEPSGRTCNEVRSPLAG
jgi:hypothetical protein